MAEQTALTPFDLLLDIDRRSREQLPVAATATAVTTTAASSQSAGRLAVRVGPWNFLLTMDDVAEIIPVPRVTIVPGVKPWLLGIANLRGTVMVVVDWQHYLGGKPAVLMPNSRLIVVRSGEWHYGLLADEIINMRQFSTDSRLPSLDGIAASLRPYISEAFAAEQQQWLALMINRLLEDPRFLNATS